MKVTIENFPKDIAKVNTKSFPKGLQDEIKNTLAEPNEYKITWSEYLDVSDASFLELLVSKVNEAIEKDNKPKVGPKTEPKQNKGKSKPKGKAKSVPKPVAKVPYWKTIEEKEKDATKIYTLYNYKIRYNGMYKKWQVTSPNGDDASYSTFKEAVEYAYNGTVAKNVKGKLTVKNVEVAKPAAKTKSNKKTEAEKEKEALAKKEVVKEKLEKEVKELLAKVKANAKLKDKIVSEVKIYLNANGLAGKPDKKPMTLDEKIKMLKHKKHFYTNILSGDKADFKAIGKRVGLSYRTSTPKKK